MLKGACVKLAVPFLSPPFPFLTLLDFPKSLSPGAVGRVHDPLGGGVEKWESPFTYIGLLHKRDINSD